MGLGIALALLVPRPASAHGEDPPAPHDLWSAWNVDVLVLASLVLPAVLYLRGAMTLWHRVGIGRGVGIRHASAFLAGIVALAVALISPLDRLSAALFSAHMVQHLLLVLVAAPLLVLGMPVVALLWGLPLSWRQRAIRWRQHPAVRASWHVVTQPVVVWVLHVVTLWIWHTPRFYQAAIANEFVHVLEHACFFTTALLFWWIVVQPTGRRSLQYGVGIIYVFAMAIQGSLLGALITFADSPWYAVYAPYTVAWRLTPLQDQQLAGLIMWIPAGVVYLAAAAAMFLMMLRTIERRVEAGQARVAARHPSQAYQPATSAPDDRVAPSGFSRK